LEENTITFSYVLRALIFYKDTPAPVCAGVFVIMFGLGELILVAIEGEELLESGLLLHVGDIVVCLHIVLSNLQQAYCDVGAVVTDTLNVGQVVVEYKAQLNGAFAALQTCDVAALGLINQLVDNVLDRLNLLCNLQIGVCVGADGDLHNLADSQIDDIQIALCVGGEYDALVVHFLSDLNNVLCMVAYALQVAYGVQALGYQLAVAGAESLAGNLNKEGTDNIFILVQQIFLSQDGLGKLAVELIEEVDGLVYSALGMVCHLDDLVAALSNGKAGAAEQTLVQHDGGLGIVALVGNQTAGQSLQLLGEGQEHEGGADIEYAVAECNAGSINGIVQESGLNGDFCNQIYDKEDKSAYNIKGDMHSANTLCVAVYANRRDHSGDARKL